MPRIGGGSRGRSSFGSRSRGGIGSRGGFGSRGGYGSRGIGSSFGRSSFGRRSGGGGRSGPSPFTMERLSMPASGPNGFYFPFDQGNTKFDLSSYDSNFCEGRVSIAEIENINQDMKKLPPPITDCCPTRCLMGLIVFLLTGALCLCTGLLYSSGHIKTSTSTYSYSASSSSSRLYTNFFLDSIDLGIIIGGTGFLGLALAIFLCCSSCSQVESHNSVFESALRNLFAKHQTTTFQPKQMTMRLSPFQSYMSITFDWKTPALPVVNDQQLAAQFGVQLSPEHQMIMQQQQMMMGMQANQMPPGFTFPQNQQVYQGNQPPPAFF